MPSLGPILDHFNRADSHLADTADWIPNGVSNDPAIVSNQIVADSAGQTWSVWHELQSMPACASIQLVTIGDPSDFTAGFGVSVFKQGDNDPIQPYDQDYTGYCLFLYPATDDESGLGHYQLGYGGNIGDGKTLNDFVTGSIALAAGSYYGLSVEATPGDASMVRMTGWVNSGSGWTEIDHFDETVATLEAIFPTDTGEELSGYAAGYIAPVLFSTDYVLDNFGGGVFPAIEGGAEYEVFVSASGGGTASLVRKALKQIKPTSGGVLTLTKRLAMTKAISPTAGGVLALTKKALKPVSASAGGSLTVDTMFSIGQIITASAGGVLALTRQLAFVRTISAASGAAVTVVRVVVKPVSVAAGCAVTIRRGIATTLSFSCAATVGFTKRMFRAITASAGSALVLATSKIAGGAGGATAVAINASAGATMTMRRTIRKGIAVASSARVVGTVTKLVTKSVFASVAGSLGLHRRASNLLTADSEATVSLTPASPASGLLSPAEKSNEV